MTRGLIAGVDHSQTMVAAAGRRNAAAIRTGRLELRYGSVEDLPFGNEFSDKAFAIRGFYFWARPADALVELRRVLVAGGTLVLTILPKDKWLTKYGQLDPGSEVCVPCSGEDVVSMMRAAGFHRCLIRADPDPRCPFNYSAIGIR